MKRGYILDPYREQGSGMKTPGGVFLLGGYPPVNPAQTHFHTRATF